MIRCLKTYRVPFLLTISLFIAHFFTFDFNSKYDQPIGGDAQAYYAYLPAIFIYNDLSYGFVDEVNEKYYVETHQKSFLNAVGDKKVNKTFPGWPFCMLHFLLLLMV